MPHVDYNAPSFVVGTTRSGTTLMRLILGHHSRIARCEEFDFAVDFLRESHDGSWPDANEYRQWLAECWTFRRSPCTIDPEADYPDMLRHFLRCYPQHESETHVGAVVHRMFHHLPRVWPDARYIHLVRDPRNVAISNIGMGWAGTVWHGTEFWLEAERHWDQLHAQLKDDQFIEVQFEDLVNDAEAVVRRICTFIGVDYEPTMLEIDHDTTYSPPRPGVASNWRTRLTDRQVRHVEARIGDMLIDRGYTPSGLPPLRVSTLERMWLGLLNKVNKLRWRVRRFGLSLTARHILSQRLPFKGWRRRVKREFENVVIAHLK